MKEFLLFLILCVIGFFAGKEIIASVVVPENTKPKISVVEDTTTTPSYVNPTSYTIVKKLDKYIPTLPHGTPIQVCDKEFQAVNVIEYWAEKSKSSFLVNNFPSNLVCQDSMKGIK